MPKDTFEKYITVNEYLDFLNDHLTETSARVLGEITDIQLYEGRSYLFFKIKDKENDAVLNCFMWKRNYSLSGVDLQIGLEVVVSGRSNVYKPLGRLSFQVESVELVGEGQLKKAYDELKAKLNKEGIFDAKRKRPLPVLPQKIGLITSKDGAAIGDFQVNLGKYGYIITFVDSRVEGQQAVSDLSEAIHTLREQDIEVLVIVRGGGSLESLLPFNNEVLVREIIQFPVPVLIGVGHEKDISLMGLAADKMVSTPTAAAKILNESWEQASTQVQLNSYKIFSSFERAILTKRTQIQNGFGTMREQFEKIFDNFDEVHTKILNINSELKVKISELKKQIERCSLNLLRGMSALIKRTDIHVSALLDDPMTQMFHTIRVAQKSISFKAVISAFSQALRHTKNFIIALDKNIQINNPERQLRLGYSIVRTNGKIIKSINKIKKGQLIETQLQNGSFESHIININK